MHTQSAAEAGTLRISLDTKAKVKIGEFSRRGCSRGSEAVKAWDHDMGPDAILVPTGILEVESDQLGSIRRPHEVDA